MNRDARGTSDKMLHLRTSSILVSFKLVYQILTKSQHAILSTTKKLLSKFEIVGQGCGAGIKSTVGKLRKERASASNLARIAEP